MKFEFNFSFITRWVESSAIQNLMQLCGANVQATFEKLENEMKEINSNAEALKRNFLDLTELKHILRKTQSFFEEVTKIFRFQYPIITRRSW